ncbi:MAG: SDR family oxidoreductase, partial [Cytophagales bacterium]|nr:SDR family oxidoreductase [Cytophagales bacterium]
GGAGALGGSMGTSLAKAGAKIVILDRNEDSIRQRVEEIESQGGTAMGLSVDVLDKNSLESARDRILEAYGRVDVLINAAGGNMSGATIGPDQTVFDLKMDDFQKVVDLNLNGTVMPSLVFGKVMADQTFGNIINISSMTVSRALTRVAGYSAGKAAMENFTRWMSVEMAQKFGQGIRVNAIAPGFFIGEQNRALLTNPDGSFTDRGNTIIQNTPMNRFGDKEELNGAIHFLCSEAASFITGVVIPIDGGFSAFSGV